MEAWELQARAGFGLNKQDCEVQEKMQVGICWQPISPMHESLTCESRLYICFAKSGELDHLECTD